MSAAIENVVAKATRAPIDWNEGRARRVFEGAVHGHRVRRRRQRVLHLATMDVALSTFAFGAVRASAGLDESRVADEGPSFTTPPPEVPLAPVARGPRIDDAGYGRD